MTSTIQTLVALLAVIAAIGVLAARLTIPPAILLVIAGIFLGALPGLPTVALAPEFFLLFILPPLIYDAAVAMSWREFRFNLRPITLLAVGCVLFTTVTVAAAAHLLLNLSWPVGFLLGAIVSPPDAVAPISIGRRMQLPRRIMLVLEGEGLANDATALILYRFAVAAISMGMFSTSRAVGTLRPSWREKSSGASALAGSCSACGIGSASLELRSRSRSSPLSWPSGRQSNSADRACSPP